MSDFVYSAMAYVMSLLSLSTGHEDSASLHASILS